MRVAVIGGTGALGRPVVQELVARGDDVLILTRTPPATAIPGAEHRPIDLRTGAGIAAALDGVEAVVDTANSTAKARDLLVEGTRRVLQAGAAAGVAHHLLISIVGCDRVPLGYYGTKVEQEQVVADGPVPWSLLRASQFHTLVDGMFSMAARFGVSPRMRVPVQPVDPADVAARLADAVHAGPGGRLADLAGPQVEQATDLAATWGRVTGRRRLPLPVPIPGRMGRALRGGGLCAPEGAVDGATFEQWLRAQGTPGAA